MKKFVTYEQFGILANKLVELIKESNKIYEYIVTIPTGGLPLAAHLANKLNIHKDNVILPNKINHELFSENNKLLYGDDLIDTVVTLYEFQMEYGVMDSAVLFYKPDNKQYPVTPTYYVSTTDLWLIFPWEDPNEKPNREGYE